MTFDKETWWDVVRRARPDITRAEFERQWRANREKRIARRRAQ